MAVDYIRETLDIMAEVWKTEEDPEIEANVEQAFKILKENPFYQGDKPKVN